MSVIVIYVLDSLRADALEPYGGPDGSSPRMGDLAAEGVVFERAFAQSTWTRPSGASILSSTYPGLHGVGSVADPFPPDLPTIATELGRAGYTTVGISAMGNVAPAFGFDSGFDDFRTLFDRDSVLERNVAVEADSVGWENHFDPSTVGIATGEDINREIEAVLDAYDGDIFLFVWSLDPHDPYYHRDPSMATFAEIGDDEPIWNHELEAMTGDADRSRLRNLYRDMVLYADSTVGGLVDLLKAEAVYDETLLVVTGDHGEAFGEHGINGHRGKPYEEQIHVPLILKPDRESQGAFGPGRRSDVVETIDLYPTLCEAAGIVPENRFVQGRSLAERHDDPSAFAEVLDGQRAYRCLRTDRRKYIDVAAAANDPRGSDALVDGLLGRLLLLFDRDEAYDLRRDPGETDNAIDRMDVAPLRRRIERRMRANRELGAEIDRQGTSRIDGEVESHLADLGYLE